MTKLQRFEYAKNVLKWTCDENGNVFNKNGIRLGSLNKQGYLKSAVWSNKSFEVKLHQYVFWYFTDSIVDEIDHINQIRTDNSIHNLRAVTRSENQFNRKDTKGYWFDKKSKKFRSKINYKKNKIYLGYFETESEAYNAYLKAKEKYHKI